MYNPDTHHRRSIRLKEYDYASVGAYFVTTCTQNREILFGNIHDGEMTSNEAGRMLERYWLKLPEIFIGISLDEFTIMPNHFHGIICITDIVGAPPCGCPDGRGFVGAAPRGRPPLTLGGPGTHVCYGNEGRPQGAGNEEAGRPHGAAPTLGDIMDWFKTMTTNAYIRGVKQSGWTPFPGRLWQRNYYERVIRNDYEMAGIREYIHFNPANWADDEENAKP